MRTLVFLSIIILPTTLLFAQPTAELNALRSINGVWAEFYTAFETLDVNPMKRIHSKRLVRVSGGKRISDYKV